METSANMGSFQSTHWRENNIQLWINKVGVLQTKAWRLKCCPLLCILVINVGPTIQSHSSLTSSFAPFLLEMKMIFSLLQTTKRLYLWMSRLWNHNLDTIQEYLLQYTHRNLIDTKKQSQLLEPWTHTTRYSCLHFVIGSQKSEYKTNPKTYWPRVRYWYCEYGAHWGTTTRNRQHCLKSTCITYPHMYCKKWQNFLCEIHRPIIFKTTIIYIIKKNHSFHNHMSSCAQTLQVCIDGPQHISYAYTWLFIYATWTKPHFD